MEEIDINEAQPQITTLIDRVAAGEVFVITRDGKPVMILEAYKDPQKDPRIGFMKGRISVPDDFDTMMADEIAEMFYGADDLLPNYIQDTPNV